MKILVEIKYEHPAKSVPVWLHTENVTSYFYYRNNWGRFWFRPPIYCPEQDAILEDIRRIAKVYGKVENDGFITFMYPSDYMEHEKPVLNFILMMLVIEPALLKMYRPYDYKWSMKLFKFVEYPKVLEDIHNGRLDMSILVYFLDTFRYF